MNNVPGTRGYEKVVDSFLAASQALNFAETSRSFVRFLPPRPARVLDAGSGAGQNAAALARMGYSVVAVEPFSPFLDAARQTYRSLGITWVEDSLPLLGKLGGEAGEFDFILIDAVWHHLDEAERASCMARLSTLLSDRGACALSLRQGPAGAGTHVFPVDDEATAALASQHGLRAALLLAKQPSIMKNKPDVSWTRLVLVTDQATPKATPGKPTQTSPGSHDASRVAADTGRPDAWNTKRD